MAGLEQQQGRGRIGNGDVAGDDANALLGRHEGDAVAGHGWARQLQADRLEVAIGRPAARGSNARVYRERRRPYIGLRASAPAAPGRLTAPPEKAKCRKGLGGG